MIFWWILPLKKQYNPIIAEKTVVKTDTIKPTVIEFTNRFLFSLNTFNIKSIELPPSAVNASLNTYKNGSPIKTNMSRKIMYLINLSNIFIIYSI